MKENENENQEENELDLDSLPCKGECITNKECCRAESDLNDGGFKWSCTLPHNHKGPHVACGSNTHGYCTWE